jgi:hypothetical protein
MTRRYALIKMKKYILISFAVVAFFSMHQNTAHAYDTADARSFMQINDARIQSDGSLKMSWQKKCAGLFCDDLPLYSPNTCGANYTEVFVTMNGTSTTGVGGNFTAGYILSGTSVSPFPNKYSSASYVPNGNSTEASTIWDAVAQAYVPTSNIISTNPTAQLYVNIGQVSRNTLGCGTSNFDTLIPVSYDTLYINASDVLFNYSYVTPASGTNIGGFPNWSGIINYTGTGNPTTTVTYSVGPTTSTMAVSASGTFYLTNGVDPITVPNNVDFSSPQNVTTTDWYYTATVVSSGTTITFPVTHFQTSQSGAGGACDNPIAVSLTNPFPSSTITNDFQYWGVSTPQLLEGCDYTLRVAFTADIGSLAGSADHTDLNITPTYNPSTVQFHKSANIWNYYNATTTAIGYQVMLLNNADGFTVGYNTGQFYLGFSATSSSLTTPAGFNSTLPCGGVCNNFGTVGSGIASGSIGTATSTVALAGNKCTAPSNGIFSFFTGEDLAYGFCVTINWLFVPNDTTKGILAGDMNALQVVPPFSWFFMTNNAILSGVQNGAHLTPNLGITYEIAGSSVIPTSSLTILPADLASMDVAGGKWSEFMNVWFNFVLTALIILCIIMLYKVAL